MWPETVSFKKKSFVLISLRTDYSWIHYSEPHTYVCASKTLITVSKMFDQELGFALSGLWKTESDSRLEVK